MALGPGIRLIEVAQAKPEGEAAGARVVSGAKRWGLLIDTNRCDRGCRDCVSACAQENGFGSAIELSQRPQWIRKVDLKDLRTGREASAPVMCQHCADPPCVDVCPTGASFKRADGIVLVDRHTCIGCRYCMMACPYKARSFVHEPVTDQKPDVPRGKGCVEGCTFCVHRIDRGQEPACVQACTQAGHSAMLFGDLNDPDSEISKKLRTTASSPLRADLRLGPAVQYEGV
jgi:molybdopterin-containing oxidoreductase family iron-sulfur binding subunit